MDLIRFIFACFGKFANTIHSHHIRFRIFAQIHRQIFDLICKNTCCSAYSLQSEYSLKIYSYWRMFASKYSFISEYLQNFQRISHSNEYSLANIGIQANILKQIFPYQRIFATYCFTSLRPQLIFGSFGKHSLRKAYSLPFLFILHVKSAASKRNKRIKPVVFATNRISRRTLMPLYYINHNFESNNSSKKRGFWGG
jgi:hypothetical protein